MEKIVTVTAGHGGIDPGAVGNGFTEAYFAADMRNYIAHYLTQANVKVRTDGTGSTNGALKDAVKLIKGSAIAVEVHLNASTSHLAKGIEVLAQPKDKTLAQAIAKAIASVTGSPLRGDKGYKPENAGQHSRLAYVSNGGLIIELDFISNKDAMAVLNEKRWLVGKAIANAILDHL